MIQTNRNLRSALVCPIPFYAHYAGQTPSLGSGTNPSTPGQNTTPQQQGFLGAANNPPSTASTGFGQQTGAFGQTSSSGGFGAQSASTGGAFGATNTNKPSLFGSGLTNPPSAFGGATPSAFGGGMLPTMKES